MKTNAIQSSSPIAPTELIITENGAIYHLNLRPDQIAPNVIVVGDQGRVDEVSAHFDEITHRVNHREFVTHTGRIGNFPISVLSTGIGTDNIDIVVNELDALFNIDFDSKLIKSQKTSLNIIRLGTSGSLQKDIPVDAMLISTHGLGLDGVMHFYNCEYETDEIQIVQDFVQQTKWSDALNAPYIVKAGNDIFTRIKTPEMFSGITATANGFYGPQGRILRLPLHIENLNDTLHNFNFNGHRITNFEMETSALYGLSAMLGHQSCTVCAIIANRFNLEFSKDYKASVKKMIGVVLDRLTSGY
jgi:uridine phosphorylase